MCDNFGDKNIKESPENSSIKLYYVSEYERLNTDSEELTDDLINEFVSKGWNSREDYLEMKKLGVRYVRKTGSLIIDVRLRK